MDDETEAPAGDGRTSDAASHGRFGRRTFLAGAAAAGAAVALPGGTAHASNGPVLESAPLHGPHPVGVAEDPSPVVEVAVLDVIAERRADLVDLLKSITTAARFLTAGGTPPNLGPVAPPSDNGVVGPVIPGNRLQMTLGFGSELFDGRFGLSGARPKKLTLMRPFPNDNLDPSQTHGDLSLQLRATDSDLVVHGLRYMMSQLSGGVQLRWRIGGVHGPARPSGTARNYQGFKDGIAHPDVSKPAIANELLWVQPNSGEPAWASGGTYQVVRIIRMLVEFWDRVSLQEQETMIGRRKASGAPLDGNTQGDVPNYAADPHGYVIPLTAHIRVANPRTTASSESQILRRGWNYDRGLDTNGNIDQGLIFTCYQRNVQRQFETVQTRLIDEPLVDYISPVGGGYFFVPPGLRNERDWYGSGMFESA